MLVRTLLLSSLLAAPSLGQSTEVLFRGGRPISDGRIAIEPRAFAVNDAGRWRVVLRVRDASGLTQTVVTDPDGGLLEAGDPLELPPGLLFRGVLRDIALDGAENVAFLARLAGDVTPNVDDRGLIRNGRLLARKGLPVGAPQVHPDTVWLELQDFRMNGADQVLVSGVVDDPSVPTVRDDALVLIQVGEDGDALTTDVLAIERQLLPGPFLAFKGFFGEYDALALNDLGEFVWRPTGRSLTERRHQQVRLGLDQVLGAPGMTFPAGDPLLDGRFVANFNNLEVALNDRGDHAFTALLDGAPGTPAFDSNSILVVNGTKFVQEGDVLPTLGNRPLDDLVDAPVLLSNDGEVFWTAELKESAKANSFFARNRAYMRDRTPILRKTQVLPDGSVVFDLESFGDAYRISPSGRHWIGRAQVTLSETGAPFTFAESVILMDFGPSGR